ncbi:hypothetical protein NB705_000277 [Xanthomonas sacchari]|nr:hypothetical protein [Xanthomonas sacchari]
MRLLSVRKHIRHHQASKSLPRFLQAGGQLLQLKQLQGKARKLLKKRRINCLMYLEGLVRFLQISEILNVIFLLPNVKQSKQNKIINVQMAAEKILIFQMLTGIISSAMQTEAGLFQKIMLKFVQNAIKKSIVVETNEKCGPCFQGRK